MTPFARRIQKANWPVSWILFRSEPPKEPSRRMTTAAIRMRAGELLLDLDRDEISDGDEDGQEREANPKASAAFNGSTGGLS